MKDELIIAYITGELEGKEKARVEEWIAESEENVTRYLELRDAWVSAMPDKIQKNHFDTDRGWDEFRYKIRAKRNRIYLQRSLTRIAGAAAAVLLLVFGVYNLITLDIQLKEFQATEVSSVTLPDSSRVTLNEGSSIKYPGNFLGESREVTIFGEGFFEVKTDKDRPFIVKLANYRIEVLGTSFNVKKNGESAFEVYVKSGSVLVYKNQRRDEGKKLLPGDLLSINSEGAKELRAAGRNYLCWKTQELEFVNTPLREVVQDMEHCYNVSIDIDSETLGEMRLTTHFKEKSLEEALRVIELIFDMRADQEGDNHFVLRTNSPPENEQKRK